MPREATGRKDFKSGDQDVQKDLTALQKEQKDREGLLPRERCVELKRRMQSAENAQGILRRLYQLAYKFAFPWYQKETIGNVKDHDLIDGALDPCIVEFMNAFSANMISKVFPPEAKWLRFYPSDLYLYRKAQQLCLEDQLLYRLEEDASDVYNVYDQLKKGLTHKFGKITERFFEIIQQSNFYEMLSSHTRSMCFGTSHFFVSDNHDNDNNPTCVSFCDIPPLDLFVELTDDGVITGSFRRVKIRRSLIQTNYPGFKEAILIGNELSDPLEKDKEIELWEACVCDGKPLRSRNSRTGKKEEYKWKFCVFYQEKCGYTYFYKYNPFVTFYWFRNSGEALGRGRLIELLPSIKRLHRLLYLDMEITQKALGFKMLVPESINVDNRALQDSRSNVVRCNYPEAVKFLPTQPLPQSNYSEIEYLRSVILRASMNTQIPMQTNMTAQEYVLRLQEEIGATSGQIGDLQMKFVIPLVNNVFDKMAAAGEIATIMANEPVVITLRSGEEKVLTEADIDLDIGSSIVQTLSLPWQASNISEVNGVMNTCAEMDQIDPTGQMKNNVINPVDLPFELIERNLVSHTNCFLSKEQAEKRQQQEIQRLEEEQAQQMAALQEQAAIEGGQA